MICPPEGAMLVVLFVGMLVGVVLLAVMLAIVRAMEFWSDADAMRRSREHGVPPSVTRMGR